MSFPTFWAFDRCSSSNRKWQDYVYIQCEYKSTKQKIILTEWKQLQNLTYFVTSWPSYSTIDLETVQVVVLGQTTYAGEIWRRLVRNYELYCGKCDHQFHLNMNIEGRLWRNAVTSSVTSSTSKLLFSRTICNDLSISDVKMNVS